MASFASPKSKGRDKDQTNVTDGPKSLGPSKSNQERATGDGTRRVAVNVRNDNGDRYMSRQNHAGNQVKIGPNTKGSDTLKDPLNTYQRRVYPAAGNPDGNKDRSAVRKAAQKRSNAERERI